MTRELRWYQQEAVDAVHAEWTSGITRTAIVHATGLGKGDILASMAVDEVRAGGRTLILTHRAEIMDQLAATCKVYGPDVAVGQIQAERNELRRPITVAMVPTLAARLRAVDKAQAAVDEGGPGLAAAQRDLVRRKAKLPERPTRIICDECHFSAADTWMKVLRWAGAFDHVPTLGATATLIRGDRRGLGDVWESVADERDIGWGIENGYLVPPRGRAVVTDHVDLESAKVSKGDYQDGQLGEMVEQDTAQIVKAWMEHAARPDGRYRRTAAFTPTVASATALREQFTLAGIPAGLVLGTTPMEGRGGRRETYRKLATGELVVMVNVMVATAGWNCPPVECILQCRPTRLPGLYQQMVGRGLRPSLETGKVDCLVLDVVGASRHQRLVTLVDLHKTAVYDDSEIEKLPALCSCSGEEVATCICLPGCDLCACWEEEGSGGARPSGRRKLLGPAVYEDVELFQKSELSWLFTKAGTRFLPAGDRIAILFDKEDGTFAVGHCATRAQRDSDGTWHYDDVVIKEDEQDLDYGRRLAESWAMEYAPTVAKRGASWRKRGGRPSDAQVNFARTLGIPSPETMTKPRLSDEISIVLASQILD